MSYHLLSAIINAAADVIFPAGLLALAVSVGWVATGWLRRRDIARDNATRPGERIALAEAPFAGNRLDVADAALAVLAHYQGAAAQRCVALEIAAQPNLEVHCDPRAIREILRDLVGRAIENAPSGRVLLGAWRSGPRIHVSVSDDGAGADRNLQASRLREAERLVALQGATMAIDARAGQGTTVTLHLPAGTASPRSDSERSAGRAPSWTRQRAGSDAR